jgi:putative transposase
MALEAAKGLKTINQLASEHELHPNQLSQWKRQLLEEGGVIFSKGSSQPQRAAVQVEAELFEQIGRLKMEVEWLKKVPDSVEAKRLLIEPTLADLSIRRQCEVILLKIHFVFLDPWS